MNVGVREAINRRLLPSHNSNMLHTVPSLHRAVDNVHVNP